MIPSTRILTKFSIIQIGVSIAAVALFDMIFVSTLVSTAITTVRSTTAVSYTHLLALVSLIPVVAAVISNTFITELP